MNKKHSLKPAPQRRIAFVAPSGWPQEPAALDRAAAYFTQRDWSVETSKAVFAKHQRFAGTDAMRARALSQAAAANADIVMAVRGGYGLSRLLDQLDWPAIGQSQSLFVGHSDFTAFSLALLATTGAVSFSGPMACYDFGVERPSSFTEQAFWRVMEYDEVLIDVSASQQPKIDVDGVLWGGNLAIVASLIGSRYLPEIDGGILFLEDIGEHPYRIERMLYQLHHAGILARQQAIVLGDFSDYKLAAHDNGYTFEAMVAHLRGVIDTPIITGLPIGHTRDKLTLPIGAWCHLRSKRGGYQLALSGYPVLG